MHNVTRQYGIVTDWYELVYFYGLQFNYRELFALKNDPDELKSVNNDPNYADIQKQLRPDWKNYARNI